MTPRQILAIRQLRDAGYAVCVFNPEELGGVDRERVEDRMCEEGWEAIDCDHGMSAECNDDDETANANQKAYMDELEQLRIEAAP